MSRRSVASTPLSPDDLPDLPDIGEHSEESSDSVRAAAVTSKYMIHLLSSKRNIAELLIFHRAGRCISDWKNTLIHHISNSYLPRCLFLSEFYRVREFGCYL